MKIIELESRSDDRHVITSCSKFMRSTANNKLNAILMYDSICLIIMLFSNRSSKRHIKFALPFISNCREFKSRFISSSLPR